MLARFLPALLGVAAAAPSAAAQEHRPRRVLRETDLHYGLPSFNQRFSTRAAHSHVIPSEEHFHRRLFEHESSLPHDQLQTFMVTLHPEHKVHEGLTRSLESRALLGFHTVVGGDLLLHGTRAHADALRDEPEVRAVIPLLPELKVTPHFDKMLPSKPTDEVKARLAAVKPTGEKPHRTHPERTVSLNVRLMPRDARHAHIARRPAEELARVYAAVLREACRGAALPAAKACARDGSGASVRAERGDRTVVVEGLTHEDALVVAELLARQPESLWVEPHMEYAALNADAAAITQSGSNPPTGGAPLGTYPIHDILQLHGEEEVIGVGDSGLDAGHCFFEDAAGGTATNQQFGPAHRKIVNYRPYADGEATGQRDHGTHVVGSILGESSVGLAAQGATERGTAYKARVSFTDIGPGDAPGLAVPNDMVNNYYNIDYDNGARIHSNSWGANANVYNLPTADTDEFMALNDDILIAFAAGNSGQDGPGSIGAPATCKNCLTVGASENDSPGRQDGNVALFSSQGPAIGGRYKPDIVAPGFMVSSANSNAAGDCPITEMAGTSMATPVTSGNVALIRQYLREGFFPTGSKTPANSKIPSGALMKAMIVHSGMPLAGSYDAQTPGKPVTQPPSNEQGFGRTQLDRVLFGTAAQNGGVSAGDRLFFVDDPAEAIANGQTKTYTLPIGGTPDPVLGMNVKVTLTWTDPPAQPLDNTPLINNLDLSVDGQPGNGGADNVNTIEQATVQGTPGGTVTVTVTGTAVQQGTQKFALVVTGPLSVTSPPPAIGPPPPPRPPSAPYDGDAAAVGVTLSFLAVAVGAGAYFIYRRPQAGAAPPGGGGGGGGGGTSTGGGGGSLPPGWKALPSPSGQPYYLNEATGETQWDKPAPVAGAGAAAAPPPPPAEGPASLPAGWEAKFDPSSNHEYFYNTATGATQWERPT